MAARVSHQDYALSVGILDRLCHGLLSRMILEHHFTILGNRLSWFLSSQPDRAIVNSAMKLESAPDDQAPASSEAP